VVRAQVRHTVRELHSILTEIEQRLQSQIDSGKPDGQEIGQAFGRLSAIKQSLADCKRLG